MYVRYYFVNLMYTHASFYTTVQRIFLIQRKVVARLVSHQNNNLIQRTFIFYLYIQI